jgi:hypothetical protein
VVPVIARNRAGWVTAMLGLIRAGALRAALREPFWAGRDRRVS